MEHTSVKQGVDSRQQQAQQGWAARSVGERKMLELAERCHLHMESLSFVTLGTSSLLKPHSQMTEICPFAHPLSLLIRKGLPMGLRWVGLGKAAASICGHWAGELACPPPPHPGRVFKEGVDCSQGPGRSWRSCQR